jgi:hypothetical protein
MLYATAIATGLRLGELRSLDRAALDVDNGRLTLPGRFTKNKKAACQYLPNKLAAGLAAFADSGMIPSLYEKARTRRPLPENPLLYVPTHALKMLSKDLERAGIAKENEEGHTDFHALRVASITLASEAGANVKELQSFARHADPRLTTKVYAKQRDPRMGELAERIGQHLPLALESEAGSATGVHFEAGTGGPEMRNSLPEKALAVMEKEAEPARGSDRLRKSHIVSMRRVLTGRGPGSRLASRCSRRSGSHPGHR